MHQLFSLKVLLGLFFCCLTTTLWAQPNLSIQNMSVALDYGSFGFTPPVGTIPAGGRVRVSYSTHNDGTQLAHNIKYYYYLSVDSILDANDLLLDTSRTFTIIYPNQSRSFSESLLIPTSTPPGNYYILTEVDPHNEIAELNELDNVMGYPYIVTPAPPDFDAVEVQSLLQTVVVSQPVPIQYTVQNLGSRADSVALHFYLSTDANLSRQDILLDSVILDSLGWQQVETSTAALTLPQGTATGQYYIILSMDDAEVVGEFYENNNRAYGRFQLVDRLPDLRITQQQTLVDTVQQAAIQAVEIDLVVQNDSGATFYSGYIDFYFSRDSLLDSTDVLARVVLHNPIYGLSTGGTQALSYRVIPPRIIGFGDFYVIAKADNREEVLETNEQNNTNFSRVTIIPTIPDLFAYDPGMLTSPFHAYVGDSISFSMRVAEFGPDSSAASSVAYYLSADLMVDPSDIYLGKDTVPAMDRWTPFQFVRQLYIPQGTPLGQHYLLAYVDPYELQVELNEANNINYTTIYVVDSGLPDLETRQQWMNASTGVAGGLVEVQSYSYNRGVNSSALTRLGYYLSTDTLYDNTDVLLDEEPVFSLGPYAQRAYTRTLNLPSTTTAGAYYILFYTDHQQTETEANENNNIAYLPISIDPQHRPDLNLITHQVRSDTMDVGVRGRRITVDLTIANQSNSAAPSSILYCFLSKDSVYSYNDPFVGTLFLDMLDSNEVVVDSVEISNFTGSAGDGDYYLLLHADHSNQISETNEQNNWGIEHPVTVVGDPTQQADLHPIEPRGIRALVDTERGDALVVVDSITNLASIIARDIRVGYYLSTDSLYSNNDVYLGGDTINFIYTGGWSRVTNWLTIPQNTPVGEYYLLTYVDDSCLIGESNEANNVVAKPLTVLLPRPDLVSNFVLGTSYFFPPGAAIAMRSIETNRSQNLEGGAGGHYIGYYFSDDNVYDARDTYLGEQYIDTLGPTESQTDTVIFTIPAGTRPGTYYILTYADHRDLEIERNETNNVRSRQVTVNNSSFGAVDLTVQSPILGGTNLAPNTFVGMSATVHNVGGQTAPRAYLGYYLSTTPNYNSGLVYLGNDYLGDVNGNASVSATQNVLIPAGTPSGNYYLLFYADYFDDITESDEINNTVARPVTITGSPPIQGDLIVDYPTLTSYQIPAGELVIAASTVRNFGPAIGSSQLGCYLSADSSYSSNDISLSISNVSGLTSYGFSPRSDSLTIPLNTPPGRYYILFRADDQNQQSEASETNNMAYLVIEVLPPLVDLEVQSARLPSTTVRAGENLRVVNTILNSGLSTSVAQATGYYISTSPNHSNSFRRLGSDYVPPLAAGSSTQETASVYIPNNSVPGQYYLIVYTDYLDLQEEASEVNNTFALPFTLQSNLATQPDLTIANPSSDTIMAGTSANIRYELVNRGGGDVTRLSSVGYYWSVDTVWGTNDVRVGSSSIAGLPSGDSLSRTSTITLPPTIAPGNYYLLYRADDGTQIVEADETNNVAYTPLVVTVNPADLTVGRASLGSTAANAGRAVSVSAVVYNQGPQPTPATTMGYYLSTDSLYDGTDVFLSDESFGALGAGDSALVTSSITIPIGTATGTYYVLFHADDAQLQAEVDETNNITSQAIAVVLIQPDLVVQSWSSNLSSVEVGSTVNTTTTILNQGADTTTTSEVGYYLSTDSLYDASDVLLGTDNVSALGLQATDQVANTLTIPSNTVPGAYYLLAYTDHRRAIVEEDEQNNVATVVLTVTPILSDIRVHQLTLSATSITAGNALTVNSTLLNAGQGTADSSRVGFYLSTTPLLNANAQRLGDQFVFRLLPSGSYTATANLVIPANTPAGNYFLIAKADDLDRIPETNENNNVSSRALTVTRVVGVAQPSNEWSVRLYPNPTVDAIQVAVSPFVEGVEVHVYSAAGVLLYTQRLREREEGLSIEGPAGVYMIVVVAPDGRRIVERIVKGE